MAGDYDLSGEVRDVDGKKKLIIKTQTGADVTGLDDMIDFISSSLRLYRTEDMTEAISANVLAARLVDYKDSEKAKAAPLSNENISLIKKCVLKAYGGFILMRIMEVIDQPGLKE
jgi:hypothetical protein